MASSDGHRGGWVAAGISLYECKSLCTVALLQHRFNRCVFHVTQCGLSGVHKATLLLVELPRSFPLFLFLRQGVLTVAVLLDLVSLFTTPGAQVTPLPASYGNILTHLSLEIRLVACFEVQKFTLKCLSVKNKIFVTFDKNVSCSLYKSLITRVRD